VTPQCEVEKVTYTPFAMGGTPYRRLQCVNRANWLVVQCVDDEFNRMGTAQAMCDHCAEVFIDKKVLPPSAYTMEWIE